MPLCVHCSHEIVLDPTIKIGRLEECPNCGKDLHSCVQCKLYDRSYHSDCRESQSGYVSDKERSNFCEFFQFGRDIAAEKSSVEDSKHKLEALFKKQG